MTQDDEIRRLEESMRRLDEADPEEIDSEEYQRILDRLVKLREERDASPQPNPRCETHGTVLNAKGRCLLCDHPELAAAAPPQARTA